MTAVAYREHWNFLNKAARKERMSGHHKGSPAVTQVTPTNTAPKGSRLLHPAPQSTVRNEAVPLRGAPTDAGLPRKAGQTGTRTHAVRKLAFPPTVERR